MRTTIAREAVVLAVALLGVGCVTETEGGERNENQRVAVNAQALGSPPHSSCVSQYYDGHGYWFCPTNATWQQAREACQTTETDLVNIDDAEENAFVQANIGLDSLIGARDSVEGVWRWEHNGLQFWNGGSGGSPVGGHFTNWDLPLGQPNNGGFFGNEDCGLISAISGLWFDVSCSTPYWYVCEEDLCPSDPLKEAPGQCGCGVADTDSDGDGMADCNDACPADPDRAELPCSPDTECLYETFDGSDYFFCSNLRNHATAKSKCEAVGMQLARIDSAAENAWIDDRIATDRWLDGKDSSTEGTWTWATQGDPFWQGDFTGSAVNGAYTNWAAGQPNNFGAGGGQDCLTIFGVNGQWDDEKCNELEQYVCEDACPDDPDKTVPGVCDCGLPDEDTDGDGTMDCLDECPFDPTRTAPSSGVCGGPPCTGTAADLYPEFECILSRGDGTNAAVFSVRNDSACVVHVAPGEDNELSPAPAQRGQPTVFFPGFQRVIIGLDGTALSWTLGERSATAQLTGPACTNVTLQEDAPVILDPVNKHDGAPEPSDATTAVPIPFEIPRQLRVASGNASNGTAELTFVNEVGATVTCIYQGGSAVQEPTTELDFARGLFLEFVSCDNGMTGGAMAQGTHWRLVMQGGDPRLGPTRLDVHLGNGCSGLLEPPLTPEETVLLRQGFDWGATAALPETTMEPGVAVPVPAMHYALIYVESKEQYELLRQSKIYTRQLPLFPSELERYRGKCGTLDNMGDLRGQFLFSIIPAAAYNLIRATALTGGTGTPPPRIILRPIPDAGFANPDGTLSWLKMKESGFQYFRNDSIQQPFFDDIVEGLADVVEGAWEAGTQAIGGIVSFIGGSVKVRLRLSILNRDSAFSAGFSFGGAGSLMWRAWGGGDFIRPTGVDFELIKWDVGVLPSSYWDTMTSPLGVVEVEASQGGDVRGDGLCVHMENDAAMISHGVTENEFCDFKGLSGVFGNFDHDIPRTGYHDLFTSHREFNYLTQVTDARAYMAHVGGGAPEKQAEIAVGFVPNLIGEFQDNGPRAFVACADYGEIKNTVNLWSFLSLFASTLLGDVIHSLLTVTEPVVAKDIFLPTGASSDRSRGVVTHEYGHFVMCDVFERQDRLFDLYDARVFDEGFDESLDAPVGLLMESWADFLASQVVSGVNYSNLPHGAVSPPVLAGSTSLGPMSYCVESTCLERNIRGVGDGHIPDNDGEVEDDQYRDEIARLVSTYHDAFDHVSCWWSQAMPTNADAWRLHEGKLLANNVSGGYCNSFSGYLLQYQMDQDDSVELSGGNLTEWLGRMSSLPLNSRTTPHVALAELMRDAGYSWCEICELFAAHEPEFDSASLPVSARWEKCTTDEELAAIVGPPPDPDLRLDATNCSRCGVHHVSDNGVCVSCNLLARERADGNTCVSCDPGFVVAQESDECVECPDFAITPPVGNTCEPCTSPQKANRATNTCGDCPSDAVVDAGLFQDGGVCDGTFLDISLDMAADDFCPNDFWLEVQNVDALAAGNANESDLQLIVESFGDLQGSACAESSALFSHSNFRTEASGVVPQTGATRNASGWDCDPSPLCEVGCHYPFGDIQTFSSQEIASTGLTHLRVLLRNFHGPIERTDVAVVATNLCPPVD